MGHYLLLKGSEVWAPAWQVVYYDVVTLMGIPHQEPILEDLGVYFGFWRAAKLLRQEHVGTGESSHG